MRSDEGMVTHRYGQVHASRGSRPEHDVLAHYGALADLDLRGFRVQDSPVHDPGPRADRDPTYQDCCGGDVRRRIDLRIDPSVPD